MTTHLEQAYVDTMTAADCDAVVALWTACGLTRPWNDPHQDILFALHGPASAGIVLRQDNAVCAALLVGHDGHRGAVYYLGVDPQQRGQGLGKQLMDAAQEWLKAQGVWKLNLQLRADNTAALGFYQRLGFVDQQTVCLGKRLDGQPDRHGLGAAKANR